MEDPDLWMQPLVLDATRDKVLIDREPRKDRLVPCPIGAEHARVRPLPPAGALHLLAPRLGQFGALLLPTRPELGFSKRAVQLFEYAVEYIIDRDRATVGGGNRDLPREHVFADQTDTRDAGCKSRGGFVLRDHTRTIARPDHAGSVGVVTDVPIDVSLPTTVPICKQVMQLGLIVGRGKRRRACPGRVHLIENRVVWM